MMDETASSEVVVVQPDDGESFWQPVPANGYAEVRVSHRRHPSVRSFATGTQVIAPGCHIREHVHPAQEELLFFFEGRGEAVIDGRTHALRAGTTVYVGAGHPHKFVNTDPERELKMCWVMLPGGKCGLDDFFARIGRPRRPGEPAPEPFARPADVAAIEAETVFAPLL
jgi:mannose-6-phosphate isomerase-like protein (cupin superfamily)